MSTNVGSVETSSWYPSSYPTLQSQVPSSQQVPSNLGLDIVEVGAKSLIAGRFASKAVSQHIQIQSIKEAQITSKGAIASSLLKTGGKAALVSGLLSTGRNIYHMAKGDINLSRASGNVGADILGGAVGGMVAATSAGLAMGALAARSTMAMGTAGLIVGTIGFALTDVLYRTTGLRDKVSDKFTEIMDKILLRNDPPGGV